MGIGGFSVLQSRIHEVWARAFGSTFEDRLIYGTTDCFRPFPFPIDYEERIFDAGYVYSNYRATVLVNRNQGLTKTYNRFHDPADRAPDIERLRVLHTEMDAAVLRAYGWDDLAETVVARFLTEADEDDHSYQGRLFWPSDIRDEVLARLLALNAERHREEAERGVVPVGGGDEVDDKGTQIEEG